ncbi:Oligopeptide/dipeptide ABC transporter ATP-binding protein-like protein [Pseudomonas syringae pv. tagetis]|nr:Oligopeptide/dipeptide ABC transporter ATP-binding protein-like protein [Pseudomonas syringae pv. tagetis]
MTFPVNGLRHHAHSECFHKCARRTPCLTRRDQARQFAVFTRKPPMHSNQIPLIELSQVSKTFGKPVDGHSLQGLLQRLHLTRPKPVTHAVDRVDLRIMRGEVVGLVGESGCGKSTLGRMVAGLLPVSSGNAWVDGKPLDSLTPQERKALRLKVQMIFQDPSSSLNPRLRVDRYCWRRRAVARPDRPQRRGRLRQCPVATGRAQPADASALSPSVQRRTTPAHRYCPCAGSAAGTAGVR